MIQSGGSLGSWVDEERGQTREKMRIADTKSIDFSNAYCGIGPARSPPRAAAGVASRRNPAARRRQPKLIQCLDCWTGAGP